MSTQGPKPNLNVTDTAAVVAYGTTFHAYRRVRGVFAAGAKLSWAAWGGLKALDSLVSWSVGKKVSPLVVKDTDASKQNHEGASLIWQSLKNGVVNKSKLMKGALELGTYAFLGYCVNQLGSKAIIPQAVALSEDSLESTLNTDTDLNMPLTLLAGGLYFTASEFARPWFKSKIQPMIDEYFKPEMTSKQKFQMRALMNSVACLKALENRKKEFLELFKASGSKGSPKLQLKARRLNEEGQQALKNIRRLSSLLSKQGVEVPSIKGCSWHNLSYKQVEKQRTTSFSRKLKKC